MGETLVNDRIDERRAFHALRGHIDCLLTAGASLVGRDPVQLSLQGRTLTVRHGMLVNENGHQDLVETLAELEWSNKRTRDIGDRTLYPPARSGDQGKLRQGTGLFDAR